MTIAGQCNVPYGHCQCTVYRGHCFMSLVGLHDVIQEAVEFLRTLTALKSYHVTIIVFGVTLWSEHNRNRFSKLELIIEYKDKSVRNVHSKRSWLEN